MAHASLRRTLEIENLRGRWTGIAKYSEHDEAASEARLLQSAGFCARIREGQQYEYFLAHEHDEP